MGFIHLKGQIALQRIGGKTRQLLEELKSFCARKLVDIIRRKGIRRIKHIPP